MAKPQQGIDSLAIVPHLKPGSILLFDCSRLAHPILTMDDGKAYGWMGSADLSDSDWGTETGLSARLIRTASACTVSSTLQIPSPLGPSPNIGSKVPDLLHSNCFVASFGGPRAICCPPRCRPF